MRLVAAAWRQRPMLTASICAKGQERDSPKCRALVKSLHCAVLPIIG